MPIVGAARRHDLTDAQWELLQVVLPATPARGRPRKWPLRDLIDGIRHRVRVGCPWRDVPDRYGPWGRIYALFATWQILGVWERVEDALRAVAQARGKVKWQVSVDSTSCRGHVHAAGARRDSIDLVVGEPADHGFGRSRVAGQPRRIWPWTKTVACWPSTSPPAKPVTARSCGSPRIVEGFSMRLPGWGPRWCSRR